MLIFLLILSGLFLNIQEEAEEESALINEKYPVVEYQNITELYDLLNQGLVAEIRRDRHRESDLQIFCSQKDS